LNGSGRSHCSHRNERGPLPPGADASVINEPHFRHLMALSVRSMVEIFEHSTLNVYAKKTAVSDKI
jgi:hypothetical protein